MSPQTSQDAEASRQAVTRTPSYPAPAHRVDNDRLDLPKRANTFQNTSGGSRDADPAPDSFESGGHSDAEDNVETTRTSIDLHDLPIELITLTDSFIESLSAKVHATPPNIEKLSRLFQDFYALASSHVHTHISALATRHRHDASPVPPSQSSFSSAASRFRSKAASLGSRDKPKLELERQMITAEELASRKKARRALEAKRGTLEEAVERRLCEGIYERIYRHRTTQDEAQDEKLRSKTAALALVGITPIDLGVDYGEAASSDANVAQQVTAKMRESLGQARADLVKMSAARYPFAKTSHLKAAHKSIVDTLAEVHPSASADEIMPMLIYTLITLPPENLSVISDLHFVQYFRWEQKLTGEAAYCLTNLEAAISFLQTVDLSTLRADEHPSGPPKLDSQVGTPRSETFPPAYGMATPPSQSATAAAETGSRLSSASKPTSSPSSLRVTESPKNRRLSDLVNTPAQAFGAASGAVFSTADQGLKTISSSLGESYSFLLGKLRERQEGPKDSIVVVPRTLDDARKLVSTPPPASTDEDDTSAASSVVGSIEDTERPKRMSIRDKDRVLNLIGGRRDASVDSVGSSSGNNNNSNTPNSKRIADLPDDSSKTTATVSSTGGGAAPASAPAPAMLDSVRNLGNSFNPIGRLSSMSMMRGFGRSAAPVAAAQTATTDGGDLATAFPDIAAALPPKQVVVPKMPPPSQRFMEVQGPGDLKIGEVRELLRDYRRLAVALKNLGAFDEK